MGDSLYDKIKYWLESYVEPNELEGVAAMINHLAWKHIKIGIVVGFITGFFAAIILLNWLS